jgi:DNA-binding beta-propeller fold protein YncE
MTRTRSAPFFSGLALLAACGDNFAGPPDAPTADAAPPPARAVIAAGSFTPGEAGVLSALAFDPLKVTQRVAPTGAVGGDPMLRRAGGELFVVNRTEGNVTILDAATFAVRGQLATGAGSNPQDVAATERELFVPALASAGVLVIERATGARTTIDLSSLDPDGEPNCISVYLVGADVYVACGLLDGSFMPRGPGQIVVLDATSHAVKASFPLVHTNPFGHFERLPDGVLGGGLVIPTVPSFTDFSTGCVERVETGASPKAGGCVVSNQQLGGFAARLDVQDRLGLPLLWLIVSSFTSGPRGNLQGYDLETRTLWPIPISPPSQVLADLAVCPNGMIVVADQTTSANGVRVYDGIDEQTTAAMPIGLRPGSSHGLACYQ